MKKILLSTLICGSLFTGSAMADLYSSSVQLYKINKTDPSADVLVSSVSSALTDDGVTAPVSSLRTISIPDSKTKDEKQVDEGVTLNSTLYKTDKGLLYYFDYHFSHYNLISKEENRLQKVDYQQKIIVEPGKTYKLDGFGDTYLKVKVEKVSKP